MSIGDGDIVYEKVRVRFDYDELVELVRDLGFEDEKTIEILVKAVACLLYTSPSPRDHG